MVKIEEIPDDASSGYVTESETSSIADPDDIDLSLTPYDPSTETLLDRIMYLRYIFPPSVLTAASRTSSFVSWTARGISKVSWVLSTTAILLAVPVALAVEGERMMVMQEREMNLQRSGQQILGKEDPFAKEKPASGVHPSGF
ncbi:hypothetical protein BT69DRAFT_352633 [Atractiella rhizophila]|nr:hypothetical protein BT69DRAFT_352633 [Atractiella rhizophila]